MLVVDIQGFEFNKVLPFLIKEVTILNTVTNEYVHRFVRLPLSNSIFNNKVKKHIQYTVNNIHGIEWEEKDYNSEYHMDFEDLSSLLYNLIAPTNMTVVVYGKQKKEILNKYLKGSNTIINMEEKAEREEEEDCLSLQKMKEIFKSHHCNAHLYNCLNCTLENVYNLSNYLIYCKRKKY